MALTEDEDFLLYPLNELPTEWIELIQPETRLNSNSRVAATSTYIFDKGQANVTVIGKFGYSATPPDDIKLAAMKLVGGVIKENVGDIDVKEISAENLGEYGVNYVKIKEMADRLGVNDILNNYVRKPIRPVSGVIKAS